MVTKGIQHSLFANLHSRLADKQDFRTEVMVESSIFEQKIFFIPDSELIRVYSHDITEQKRTEEIIRQKNKDIIDSINYAKKIQFSLLPTEKYIARCLERLKRNF